MLGAYFTIIPAVLLWKRGAKWESRLKIKKQTSANACLKEDRFFGSPKLLDGRIQKPVPNGHQPRANRSFSALSEYLREKDAPALVHKIP